MLLFLLSRDKSTRKFFEPSTFSTCIDVSSTDDTTTRDDNTFIRSLVDVTCVDVAHNNINIHRTGNTITRDDNTCNNNAAVSSFVDVTCIDVSSTDNATTRDDNTFISSLVDVTVGSFVDVTCIDVSSTDDTTTLS